MVSGQVPDMSQTGSQAMSRSETPWDPSEVQKGTPFWSQTGPRQVPNSSRTGPERLSNRETTSKTHLLILIGSYGSGIGLKRDLRPVR
jgi:hypothetical protein